MAASSAPTRGTAAPPAAPPATTRATTRDAGGESTVHKLDNRATPCSLGLLRVKERLSEIPLGDSLEVVTRDRFAPYEVPAWVERQGLELASLTRSGFWLFASTVFVIRKTVAVKAPRRRLV